MRIAIIGGGASGLACAAELLSSEKDFQLKIFEKNERVGKKLLATGNGRCNLFNERKADYVSLSFPDVSEELPLKDNKAFFEDLGVPSFADEQGRCYPLSNRASSVLDALRFKTEDERCETIFSKEISSVSFSGGRFLVEGEGFDFLVLALGGKAQVRSYNGEKLISQFDHGFSETSPALVKFSSADPFLKSLNGIRAKASVELLSGEKPIARENGELQFSSDSVSGICAMQLSIEAAQLMLKNRKCFLKINFIPSLSSEEALRIAENVQSSLPDAPAEMLLSGMINKKIAAAILKKNSIAPDRTCKSVSADELRKIIAVATDLRVNVSSLKGYNEAQVMLGGVDLNDIDIETLESGKIKNLYFCGEILDVTGYCGGYNLNWAWSSGRTVAQSILNKL